MALNNEELIEMARKAIDLEMELFLRWSHLNETPKTREEERRSNLEEKNRDIQEMVVIKRNEINQQKLLDSIEIVGLPDDICENSHDVADVLTQIFHFRIQERQIRGFETTMQFTGPNLGEENPVRVNARTLVVHLEDHDLRNRIMEKATMLQLCYPGVGRVLVYEHLTQMTRLMFWKACQMARINGIDYVWIKDGSIYARKNRYSLLRHIRSAKDIENMRNF